MAICHWPEGERPREKLLQRGPQALSDAELLAIFLRTGVAGKSAVDLARELLQHFDGLQGLMAAKQATFCAAHGLGPAKFAQLQAVLEMSARYFDEQLAQTSVVDNVNAAKRLAKARLAPLKHEVFAVFFLDSQHCLIRFEIVFSGTIDGAEVYPREIAKRALELNAAALLLAHNHPSGSTNPSDQDKHLTRVLIESLGLFDIRVLDHIIVGAGEPLSFTEQNLLPELS